MRFVDYRYNLSALFDESLVNACAFLNPIRAAGGFCGRRRIWHLLLDHEGYLPVYAHVTEGNVPEIQIARALSLPKGSIVVMDRGYIDYKLFSRWTKEGIRFVTRLKEKADYVAWEST